jgi:hypothetical protein
MERIEGSKDNDTMERFTGYEDNNTVERLKGSKDNYSEVEESKNYDTMERQGLKITTLWRGRV